MADPFANMPPEQIASIQYQLANADDDRSGVIYASTWALWFLAFVGILLRFYAKRIVNSGFLWEDGTILAAFLCATGLVIIPPSAHHMVVGDILSQLARQTSMSASGLSTPFI